MHRTTTSVVALACALGMNCAQASVAAVQWLASAGGNNHWYELVQVDPNSPWSYPNLTLPSGGINFGDAEHNAEKLGGYLATPSLPGEAEFIYNTLVAPTAAGSAQVYWLGAKWNASDGWSWVTGGPVTSWGGATTYFDYYAIPPGDGEGLTMVPNNYWTASDALQDLPLSYGDEVNGYVVEFNTSPVPEPETDTMILIGLGVVSLVARRRKGIRII